MITAEIKVNGALLVHVYVVNCGPHIEAHLQALSEGIESGWLFGDHDDNPMED